MSVAWVDALPSSIRVGTHDCLIQKMERPWGETKLHHRYGDYDAYTHVIRIRRRMRARSLVVDTIMHELLHAVWNCYSLKGTDKEERIVHSISSGITQIMRDNPGFVVWLQTMNQKRATRW